MPEVQHQERTDAMKMCVKAGVRAQLVDVPAEALAAMRLPELQLHDARTGLFQYLHLFTTSMAKLDELFPVLKEHLAEGGQFWVPGRKARIFDMDPTPPAVIRVGS